MDGVDDLAGIIAEFEPGPGRRLGVLVDHLVPGTKEARIVEQARALPGLAAHVQDPRPPLRRRVAVRAARAARLAAVAGHPARHLVEARHLRRARWAHESQADIARAWKRILGTVRTYADLEPTLLASVEELIDFVTEPVG